MREEAATWVQEMSRVTRLAYVRRRDYPVRTADYETLISDTKLDDDA